VVLRGSKLNPNLTRSCPRNIIQARRRYADNIDSNNVLTVDVLLTSPSAAAGFIGGASLNGNDYWKEENGRTLGQMEEANG